MRQKIEELGEKQERFLQVVKRRKLQRYGHIARNDSLAKTILQGTFEGGRKSINQENLDYPTSKNGPK